MIRISKNYIDILNREARLCSNITADKWCGVIWFAIDTSQKEYLSVGRADAFVMALLPMAMRSGQNIVCEDVLSERLRYQMNEQLIPMLALEEGGQFYHPIQIDAPFTVERCHNIHGVGVCFSEGDDFLYTVACHGGESEYPLTHTAVFHIDTDESGRDSDGFQEKCRRATAFSEERNLQTICLDTNLGEALQEKTEEVSTFRKLACALALQGLFSVFLLPTEKDVADFRLDLKNCAAYDLLTIGCGTTESLTVYLSGAERKEERQAKMKVGGPFTESLGNSSGEKEASIRVGKPYTEAVSGAVRLCAQVFLHGEEKDLWFAVRPEYAAYLTEDRADAFVTALLTTAMRNGENIVCEAPVTRRLLYQMNQYLIPIMSSNMNEYREIKICAEPTDAALDCYGAVGTGWTGGVDSMFTIQRNMQEPEKSAHRITHLMIASNGAIEGVDPSDTLEKMTAKAQKGIAPELGLNLIGIDSNLQEVLPENFRAVASIRHGATILALQKLFRFFMVSSSFDISQLSFKAESMGYYEFVVLNFIETPNTSFYSAGGTFDRNKKLLQLSDYRLAKKYLHPCIYALKDRNCGKCGKCVRTQAALYALGTLNCFGMVFDLDEFERNKNLYIAEILAQKNRRQHCAEIAELFQKNNIDISQAKHLVPKVFMQNKWKVLRSMIRHLNK